MALPRAPQGDSHNFGRRVSVRGSRVAKPRAILWESLLLSAKSPLRRFLDDAAARDELGRDAFSFVPTLKFYPSRSGIGGEVERLVLRPLPKPSPKSRHELATIVGRSLALWSWLGVSDLHWENLALGLDSRGRIVLAPLDIEMILADLSLPTETKLIPDADPEYAEICRHASGVRRVLPYLGKPVDAADVLEIASAYLLMLAFLDHRASGIARVLARLPRLRQTPIRICLRGTDDYVRARSMPLWPPLLDAETEQLARGDIPYFFRLYGQPGIHYYTNRALTQSKSLPRRGDVPRLDPILSLSRGLRSPSRRSLREQGLFTVLAAFDDATLTGRHDGEALDVTFAQRTLTVRLRSGEELRSKRNLGAVVGSVYLPCRCGEVRTVFVPTVTVCTS